MTTVKTAITVPEEILQRARGEVRRGRARSLSAYMSEALAQKLMLEDLDALLQEMLAETGGPLTKREKAAADRALGTARKRRTGR